MNLLSADVVQLVPPTGLNWIGPWNAFFSGPFTFVNDGRGWQPGINPEPAAELLGDLANSDPLGILGTLPGLWAGNFIGSERGPIEDSDPCGGRVIAIQSGFGAHSSQTTSHFLLGKPDCKDDVRIWPSTYIPEIPDIPDIPEQPIPEPSTVLMLGTGLGLIAWCRLKK